MVSPPQLHSTAPSSSWSYPAPAWGPSHGMLSFMINSSMDCSVNIFFALVYLLHILLFNLAVHTAVLHFSCPLVFFPFLKPVSLRHCVLVSSHLWGPAVPWGEAAGAVSGTSVWGCRSLTTCSSPAVPCQRWGTRTLCGHVWDFCSASFLLIRSCLPSCVRHLECIWQRAPCQR